MTTRRTRLVFLFALLIPILLLAGCGSSSTPAVPGNFSVSSLNGTYAFSFAGKDANGRYAVAGVLTADGAGNLTSGVLDVNQQPSPSTNVSFTGTYTIAGDGRGTATLTTPAGNFTLAFVIVSDTRALVTRFEKLAGGTGAFDRVNSADFSTTALAGTFAFSLNGVDASGKPLATVGSIATDASGNITTGVQDVSDNGAVTTNQPISAGSLQVAGNGRGTVSITTATGPLNFAFYVVDANHIKLVETDKSPLLSGDAFRQNGPFSNASLTGPFAFTVSGTDTAHGPYATGAVLATDGAGAITSGSQDINDGGTPTSNIAITGAYSVDATGRGAATLTSASAGTVDFVLYPTTNGVLMLNVDSGLVASGTASAQTRPFTNAVVAGPYAMNFAQFTTTGEADANAALGANNQGGMTGLTDINDLGSLSTATPMTAGFALDSSGHGPLQIGSGLGVQNMAIYALDQTHCLFIGLDSGVVTVGDIESN